MNIDVNLSVNKELIENPSAFSSNYIASGWVEIENAFKFPVQVLKGTNKEGKQEMFVRYPAKQQEDSSWRNVVFPHDREVRTEIDGKVLEELHNQISKTYSRPEISKVTVTMLPHEELADKVVTRALASIQVCGISINGFAVKESSSGFFVQMPQHRDHEGHYTDMFYGTNKTMRTEITNSILEEYENMTKKLAAEKKPIEKQLDQPAGPKR